MAYGNFYQALSLEADAASNDIEVAFQNLLTQYQIYPESDSTAEQKLRAVQAAYGVLGTSNHRRYYDIFRAAEHDETGASSLRLDFSYELNRPQVLPQETPQVVYLLTELFPLPPPPANQPEDNPYLPPLQLSLIVDRGPHLNSSWLGAMPKAIRRLIAGMAQQDMLTIILPDNPAQILLPSTSILDRAETQHVVTKMPTSKTFDLAAGLRATLAQMERANALHPLNQVLLFIGAPLGLALPECLHLAEQAAAHGVSITALGIGDGWDEDELDVLAERCGGSAQAIWTPDDLIPVLTDQLCRLRATCATRAELVLTLEPDVQVRSCTHLNPSLSLAHPLAEIGSGEREQQRLYLGPCGIVHPIAQLWELSIQTRSTGSQTIAQLDVRYGLVEPPGIPQQVSLPVTIQVAAQKKIHKLSASMQRAIRRAVICRLHQRAKLSAALFTAPSPSETVAMHLRQLGEHELASLAQQEYEGTNPEEIKLARLKLWSRLKLLSELYLDHWLDFSKDNVAEPVKMAASAQQEQHEPRIRSMISRPTHVSYQNILRLIGEMLEQQEYASFTIIELADDFLVRTIHRHGQNRPQIVALKYTRIEIQQLLESTEPVGNGKHSKPPEGASWPAGISDILRAIGHDLDRGRAREIQILQLNESIFLQGQIGGDAGRSMNWPSFHHIYTIADLNKLIANARARRRTKATFL